MTNFAEYGLILCPAIESYENRTPEHKKLLRKSVENIITFLGTKNIKPLMLLTDQVASIVSPDGVYWAQTITESDWEFASVNCDNMSKIPDNLIKYPDFYEAVEVLYPPISSTDVDELFADMCKRVSKLEKAIILRQTVIFNIQTVNNASYNIKPEADSGVILCNIHNGSFLPTTYISDIEENPINILDYDMANHPVYEWRF